MRDDVAQQMESLERRLVELADYEHRLAAVGQAALERVDAAATARTTTPDLLSLGADAAQLARQLTHIELERLHFIGPEEFVQSFSKSSPVEVRPVQLNLLPQRGVPSKLRRYYKYAGGYMQNALSRIILLGLPKHEGIE